MTHNELLEAIRQRIADPSATEASGLVEASLVMTKAMPTGMAEPSGLFTWRSLGNDSGVRNE